MEKGGRRLTVRGFVGEEVTAQRGAIEAASPVVAAAVGGVADVADTKVIVPPIPGLLPGRAPATLELALRMVTRSVHSPTQSC